MKERKDGVRIESIPSKLREKLTEVVATVQVDFGGGSSLEKALVLAWFMLERRLDHYLEIGVYRGRSLFPAAVTCQWMGTGLATGIDPYSTTQAVQLDTPRFPEIASGVNTFVNSLDWEELYIDVEAQLSALGLEQHCKLIRSTSGRAARMFSDCSLGVLHIDGNHDEARVREDVERYRPKVQPGGILVLDDASWDTVASSRAELERKYPLIYERIDTQNDFAVFSID